MDSDIMEESNMTADPCETEVSMTTVFLVLMYILVIVLAVGGNLIVCYLVLGQKRMRTPTNFFLLNLAISDITKAILCIPFSFVANLIVPYWPFGAFMCPLVTYMQAVSVFLSAFTLVAMSFDRYVAILHPLRPKLNIRKVVYILVIVWILSFGVPLPTAVVSKIVVHNDTEECYLGICYEDFGSDSNRSVYSMILMCLQYFVPLVVLTFTYTRIGYVIWIKKTPGEAERKRDERIASTKRKMVKMMIVVVIVYAVCWLPLHAITIAGDLHPEQLYNWEYTHIVWTACHWLAMSHACYNPVVYFWMNKRFRAGFRGILFYFCHAWKAKARRHRSFNRRDNGTIDGSYCNGMTMRERLSTDSRSSLKVTFLNKDEEQDAIDSV